VYASCRSVIVLFLEQISGAKPTLQPEYEDGSSSSK